MAPNDWNNDLKMAGLMLAGILPTPIKQKKKKKKRWYVVDYFYMSNLHKARVGP